MLSRNLFGFILSPRFLLAKMCLNARIFKCIYFDKYKEAHPFIFIYIYIDIIIFAKKYSYFFLFFSLYYNRNNIKISFLLLLSVSFFPLSLSLSLSNFLLIKIYKKILCKNYHLSFFLSFF